jgi:hypothetical protein
MGDAVRIHMQEMIRMELRGTWNNNVALSWTLCNAARCLGV